MCHQPIVIKNLSFTASVVVKVLGKGNQCKKVFTRWNEIVRGFVWKPSPIFCEETTWPKDKMPCFLLHILLLVVKYCAC